MITMLVGEVRTVEFDDVVETRRFGFCTRLYILGLGEEIATPSSIEALTLLFDEPIQYHPRIDDSYTEKTTVRDVRVEPNGMTLIEGAEIHISTYAEGQRARVMFVGTPPHAEGRRNRVQKTHASGRWLH